MAKTKAKSMIVRLISMAGTGYAYYTRRNVKSGKPKLLLRKYDPVIREHTLFKEEKISRTRVVQRKRK